MKPKLKNKTSLRKQLSTRNILKPEKHPPKKFISSGDVMLNLALTGNKDKGYGIGRVVNCVGDYSSGKTLLACEAINGIWYNEHLKKGKKVKIIYDEPEAAFDYDLGEQFGMPLDDIIWESSRTVEEFHQKLYSHIDESKNYDIIFYVLDSLDSLSDEAEQKRFKKILKKKSKEGEEEEKIRGSYGATKAKYMSEMFRNVSQDLKETNCILFIISQLRDDLMARYGRKSKRSGGRALDYYGSQVFWLNEEDRIERKGIIQGISVEAFVSKNKVGKPFRKAKFDVIFKYGLDNYGSVIDFLCSNKILERSKNGYITFKDKSYYKENLIQYFEKNPKEFERASKMAQKTWDDIEEDSELKRKPKWG